MFSQKKNTVRRGEEQLTMLYAKSVLAACLCGVFVPQVIGLTIAFCASVTIYGLTAAALLAAYCLSKSIVNLVYGLGLVTLGTCQLVKCKLSTSNTPEPEKVELQSFTDYAQKIESILWKTKHIPCISLINTFLSARTKTAKMSALIGIWQLYTEEAPSRQIQERVVEILPHISHGFESAKRLWDLRANHEEVVLEDSEENDDGTEDDTTTGFFLSELLSEVELNTKLEKNRHIISIAMAITAAVACFVPATITWAVSDRKDFTKHVIEMGRFITAKNIIWTEVEKTKNTLMKMLWKVCGQEYIPDSDRAAQCVQRKVVSAMILIREYELLMNTDFFGAMRGNKLDIINEAVVEVDKLYKDLSALQKSQYNLNTIITQLREGMNSLNSKRADLMANATGKQEPVVIALFGDAGMGKSEMMKRMVTDLEKKYNITSYLRKPTDEYWSLFQGQQIIVWDDLGFKKDGKDYAEFCNHTCGVASTAIGAAIQDKGKPTNPLFIITTSNVGYIGPNNSEIVTLEAYHRRRHILVRVDNGPAAEYKATHGSTMPPELFRPSATTLTLFKPIPDTRGGDSIGTTTYERIMQQACEMEKVFANRFKDQLRLKSYYEGKIPANEPVDNDLLTTDFLIGKRAQRLNPTATPYIPRREAVNPKSVEVDRKFPVFTISGPSGTGKSHIAEAICQRLYKTLPQKSDIDDIKWTPNEIIWLDDVTMSRERYLKAAAIANQQYETGVARIVIITENAEKLYLMDQQAVAEIHRRSHLAELSYRWRWTQIFKTWSQIAMEHKAELEESTNKQVTVRTNISARVTEYGQRPVPRNATDVASIFNGFEANVYGDEVVTNGVWTLPMPSEVDFTVNLSKSFSDLSTCTMSQLCSSLFTGSVYQVKNISHRFSQVSSMGIISEIFNQAPDFKVNNIDHMVTSFNDANVQTTIRPPGTALLVTPEGAVGLTWLETTIRMFKVTTDPVELIENKIDVHKYFNNDVENEYKRLTSTLIFTEESIRNTQESIEQIQLGRFTITNVLCQIAEASLSVLSISLQIVAPISLVNNMLRETSDRSELTYLKTVMSAANKFKTQKLNHRNVPVVELSGNQRSMKEFDEMVATGLFTEDEVAHIMIQNPGALAYINHDREFTFPAVFTALKGKNIPVPADPALEHISLSPRQYYSHTYSEGGDLQKSRNGEVVLEKFKNVAAYDDWKRSKQFDEWKIKTGQFNTSDLDDRQSRGLCDADYKPKTGDPSDWAAEYESSIFKNSDQKRRTAEIKESSPVKVTKKEKPQVHMRESAPTEKPSKKIAPHIVRQTVEVPVVEGGEWHEYEYPKTITFCLFHNKNSTPEEFSESNDRAFERSAFVVTKDGWVKTHGEPELIVALKTFAHNHGYEWIGVKYPAYCQKEIIDSVSMNNAMFGQPEAQVERQVGDIVRVRRSMGGQSYWHYGVIANYRGTPHLYHVQSNDVEGTLTSIITVDSVSMADTWELYTVDTAVGGNECVVKLDNFDHIEEFAFYPFAYSPNHSHCETWALAMVYGTEYNIRTQELPSNFMSFVEIGKTFINWRSRFDEFREIDNSVREEQCVDPTALTITRNSLSKSYVQLTNLNGVNIVKGLGVRGKLILTVGHVDNDTVMVHRNINGTIREYQASRIYRNGDLDFSLYRVTDNTMPSFPNIVSHFMKVEDYRKVFAVGATSSASLCVPSGDMIFMHSCRVQGQITNEFTGERMLGSYGLGYTTFMTGVSGDVSTTTASGDCGSPLVLFAKTSQRKLIGIHRASSATTMYASIVPQEILVKAIQESDVQIQCFVPRDGVNGLEEPFVDPLTGHKVVGYSQYKNGPCRGTKIYRTSFTPSTFTTDVEPAVLSDRDPRGEGYNPALTTLRKFPTTPIHLNQQEVEEAADAVADYLIDRLGHRTLTVFTTEEAINGPSVYKYPTAGAMDRKSSAGFPQTQRDKVSCKGDYLKQVACADGERWVIDGDKPHGARLNDDLSRMLGACKMGKRPNVVFNYFPKDEVLKTSKIYPEPNTRGILAGNLPYVILYRRYMWALHLIVQEIKDSVPIKIGLDPKSMDWDVLTRYHLVKGNIGFDADAKNWDASIPVEFMKACTKVINRLYEALDPNCTEEHNLVRTMLHSCVESPYVLYDGKVLQLPGGQVSGQPGTAFDNSLINWMLCYIIYKRTMTEKKEMALTSFDSFMSHTALSVYGDDMMITLDREVLGKFDLNDYIRHAKEFGITITPADKDSANSGTLAIEKMSFLKRTFRTINSFHVGPIEGKSIAKSLMWMKGDGSYYPTSNESGQIVWRTSLPNGLLRENMEAQLLEAALHGQKEYDSLKREINSYLSNNGLAVITKRWPDALSQMQLSR